MQPAIFFSLTLLCNLAASVALPSTSAAATTSLSSRSAGRQEAQIKPDHIADKRGRQEPSRNSGKRGLAYNTAKNTVSFAQAGHASKVSWAYNWYSTAYTPWLDGSDTSSFNPALRYIPMIHSLQSDVVGVWSKNVDSRPQDTDAVLAFNEPDGCNGGGATCMAIGNAVNGYRELMTKYGPQVRLGSPAITNGATGIPWLKEFLSQCNGCQVDFVAVHWYAGYAPGIFNYFKSYLEEIHNTFGKPVWITEFALEPSASEQQQVEFMKQAVKFLDQAEWVHRYAWFFDGNTAGSQSLTRADGSLTELGGTYDNYPSDCYNFYCHND